MTPDLGALLEGAGKAGLGGAVLLVLIGLSYVITAWRSGAASQVRQKDLQERMDDLEAELRQLRAELQTLRNYGSSMRYQRDSARLIAEDLARRHSEVLGTWPPDPPDTPPLPPGGTP